MLGYILKEKLKALLNRIKKTKLISQQQISFYNFKEAEKFNEFDKIIPFSDKEFWNCIGIKLTDEDEVYIIHTKSNIVFSRNFKFIGRASLEEGILYLTEIEDVDKRIIDWYNNCLYLTNELIREERRDI